MASKKKQPDAQASLFGIEVRTSTAMPRDTVAVVQDGELVGAIVNLAVEAQKEIERPKLRLVPSLATIAESEVIVEKVRDVYEVSLLRRGNTTAAVFYTREQLEQLIARAKGALEVG